MRKWLNGWAMVVVSAVGWAGVAVVAITVAETRQEPAALVLPQPEPMPIVIVVAESDFESRELVEIELSRLARAGYALQVAAGGVGGRWFVMQREGVE